MVCVRPVEIVGLQDSSVSSCTTSYSSSRLATRTTSVLVPRRARRKCASCIVRRCDQIAQLFPKRKEASKVHVRAASGPKITSAYDAYASPDVTQIFGYPRDLDDKYELSSKVLGKGSFGIVTEATERETGDKYAIKTISKKLQSTCDQTNLDSRRCRLYWGKIDNEVSLMQQLSHIPDVVKFHKAYEDDTHVHLVLELLQGGTLQQRLRWNGPMREREAARVACAVLQFLAECHSRGIVYRDVKPENFMYSTGPPTKNIWSGWVPPRVKAVDFGQAVQMDNPQQQLAHRSGTPAYMAPEVVRKSYGQKADLWSLGMMVYQLLCGKLPFWEDPSQVSLDEVWEAILHRTIGFEEPRWARISPEATDFLRLLLQRIPNARPSAGELLEHPWIEQSRYHYKTDEFYW